MSPARAAAIAGATDPGKVRLNNEDTFVYDESLGLLLVADGMGGHNSGEVAAELAAKTILDFARQSAKIEPPGAPLPGLSASARRLEFFIKHANSLIYEKGRQFPRDAGMGTTVVAAFVGPEVLTVAHVGDSRLYLWRRGALTALTQDHSLVAEQVRSGQITAEEAARSNLQNILTRALGAEADVKVDVSEHALQAGDIVVLATDGLFKMVSDGEVEKIVGARAQAHPKEIVDALIARACAAGGVDNVTVVAARIQEDAPEGGVKGLVSRLFTR